MGLGARTPGLHSCIQWGHELEDRAQDWGQDSVIVVLDLEGSGDVINSTQGEWDAISVVPREGGVVVDRALLEPGTETWSLPKLQMAPNLRTGVEGRAPVLLGFFSRSRSISKAGGDED